MNEGENLGPASSMQIRNVPELVRKFWGDWAHKEEKTVGEVFTAHSLRLINSNATAVRTTVSAVVPSRIEDLCRVIEVCESYAAARQTPVRKGKETRVANRAFDLLNARLATEIASTPVATTVNRQRSFPSPRAAEVA
jgi:hypothetical protein